MRREYRLLAICVVLIVSACSPSAQPTVTPSSGPSAAASVTPSAAASPTSIAISSEAVGAVDTMLAHMASMSLFSGSVLISQHGHVLFTRGYGLADRDQKIPNGPQTRFLIGSNTKQFTAAAILLLEVQGKLRVTDLICNYISQCPTAWSVITIKELLTHTSGIPDYVNTLSDFVGYAGPPLTPLQVIAHFRDLPLEFTPGATWKYSNSGYFLLGYIIEQVSGFSYEAFLQKYILTPLNLSDTGYDHNTNGLAIGYFDGYATTPAEPEDPSIAYAAGALYSTVGDMNRWEHALTTDALLPAPSRAAMFAPQVAIPGASATSYGYGFLISTDTGRAVVGHNGQVPGFSSVEVRYPDDDVTIVILSNQENAEVQVICEGIAAKIFNAA